jgi:Protein of unknown function (DUF1573)
MIALRKSLVLCSLVVLTAASAHAQDSDWARKMFDTLSYDFGTVAQGAEASHRIKVTNVYREDVQISNVTTSCGCTVVKFDNTPIKSLQSSYIEIAMDTNRFKHEKTSSVTVTLSTLTANQTLTTSIVIPLRVYIRTDVFLTQNNVNFGSVEQGTPAERKIGITYVGRPDWKISGVDSKSKYVTAKAVETERVGDQVKYDLTVSLLPNAPVGILNDQVLVKTDDADAQQQAIKIPILVHARVEADITVTPSVVQLGSVMPGTTAEKTVLLRGQKPFEIQSVECQSNRNLFKRRALAKGPRTVQVLTLEFTAPKQPGPFNETFIVTVAGRRDPVTFEARGNIEATTTTTTTTEKVGLPR